MRACEHKWTEEERAFACELWNRGTESKEIAYQVEITFKFPCTRSMIASIAYQDRARFPLRESVKWRRAKMK